MSIASNRRESTTEQVTDPAWNVSTDRMLNSKQDGPPMAT
jgi:hypothetical protein